MADKLDLLKEARAARDLASRALRRAVRLTDDCDKARLRRHAEQLRLQAGKLEQRAASVQYASIF